ncbi:chorismate mutase [Streptomyces javensis]|uniref:Chorismate mutase n=1 Tax=Streptomyces javensis TaxID=114698 RepID=A0ABS0RFK8_9ACTN|nr:chorismate mutase [Streptomyces javensis]MBI0316196.1 chorismate mutase [Streptomyces javensis]
MRPHPSPRHALIAVLAATVLATGATAAVAAPAGPARVQHGTLRPLVDLSAQRVLVADEVAAAKWGTDSPIDDPAREREVLEAVARQAEELGADPVATSRIFRDQIEASKVVQRGLYSRWDADPAQAPTERPDLGRVRLEINRINGELVRAIADSAAVRESPSCVGHLAAGAAAVVHGRHLDPLHTVALGRSLPSVCGRGAP